MKKIIFFFKNWLFNIRKKQAIKKAQQLGQRATQEVLGPQLQRQAHRHLHAGHLQAHPYEAGQAALRCQLFPRNGTLHRYA